MKKNEKDKIKNIFDWLQHITLYKTSAEEFTDNDWEKFNSYMVHRFISMHVYYVEIADYAQSMLPNMKKQIYNFYREMIPKKKVWLQYIKSKTENINKDLVECIAKYYEVGKSDALSYITVMTKEELFEVEGVVNKIIPGGKYVVEIANGVEIEAHPSGKMRKNKINVLVNDRVSMQMTPYDLTKGRITFRYK